MSDWIIGVDLGGTRLRAARLNADLDVLAREEMLTLADEGFEATIGRVKDIIRRMLPPPGSGDTVAGIGVSIPGPTNPFTGVVELGTNLKGWQNVPLVQILRDEFNVPVYIGNDANVAAMAETAKGAAVKYQHVIFITVSTGIGGGVIVDGRLLLGKSGLGAEVGHMVILADGERVSTLEKEAAGPALVRQARARLEAGESSIIRERVGGDLTQITGQIVGDAARAGDPLALSIVRRAGRIVGYGVTSLLHIFNPEIVIFGGGVSSLGELLFAPMREAIASTVIDPEYHRELVIALAHLGDNVSLVGAGALVLTKGGIEKVSAIKAKLAE
ncbi:MAG: ROK family protein [Anaerolinea sp.]|nr:ROK family protein [Anaerolinea sp.]